MDNEIVDLGAVWTAREMERKLPGTVLARRAKWMLQSGATAENALRNSTASLRASRRSLLGTG
jgi:hypothetical protein